MSTQITGTAAPPLSSLSMCSSTADALAVPNGQFTGLVQRADPADHYAVQVAAGESLTVTLEPLVEGGEFEVELREADGTTVLSASGHLRFSAGCEDAVKKVIEGIKNPNGVQLSPDEKTLYANDKDGLYLLAFDVNPDGTLANRRNFGKYKSLTIPGHKDPLLAEDNGADGLAIDGRPQDLIGGALNLLLMQIE